MEAFPGISRHSKGDSILSEVKVGYVVAILDAD